MEDTSFTDNKNISETIFSYNDTLFTDQMTKTHLPRSKKKVLKKQLYKERRLEKRKIEHQKRRENKKKVSGVDIIKNHNVNICIDLDFYSLMSDKEKGKLFRQLCRVWGLGKKFSGLQTTLLNGTEEFYEKGKSLVSGFEKFNWKKEFGSIVDIYKDKQNIVYLSPDSSCQPLLEIDPETIYVIGGLVDESGVGSKSLEKASNLSLNCRRLPIKEIMQKAPKGSHNEMLSINLVVEILYVLPKRFGFVLSDDA
ncbi:tRNA methyltransferase 10 homolog B [Strongyloides ratti]|uniref:tRNA (guanine(9)-N(1))-methyltransferase n=1 Tax=Strongyloides ratti TaxID=34506 RepID=A0A090L7V2_STRRB|nr:tRNA methyltransferase 10 homolog B [Strongyloides ratti]CEF65881.1 tRNA methyltransferase 10 homolog B [Strongyloides ratti]